MCSDNLFLSQFKFISQQYGYTKSRIKGTLMNGAHCMNKK